MHSHQRPTNLILASVLLLALGTVARAQAKWAVLPTPENSFNAGILADEHGALNMASIGWGPNWAWAPPAQSKEPPSGGKLDCHSTVVFDSAGSQIEMTLHADQPSDHSIRYAYQLSSARDVPLTMLGLALFLPEQNAIPIEGVTAHLADGSSVKVSLPLKLEGTLTAVQSLDFDFGKLGDLRCTLDPPRKVQPENKQLRIMLASELFQQGTSKTSITFEFPGQAQFITDQAQRTSFVKEIADPTWFAFSPRLLPFASPISMSSWLDKPSGSHGGVRMVGDRFQFEDGVPIKFWGTNIAYALCAPPPQDAEATAARFAYYGVNAVRLHKFAGPSGWEGIASTTDATQFDPAGLDRFDFFCSKLKAAGIYYGFSHTYEFTIEPGNRSQVVAYDEIAKLKGNTYGLINFAPDIQDLLIARAVNLLKHENPYTGKTYADDPSVAFLEMQNEDDIFFFTTTAALEACPTYHKLLKVRFSDWLQKKYGSRQALAASWKLALKRNETFMGDGIEVQGNPWFMSTDGLATQSDDATTRLLDNAAFLHSEQNSFYSKYEKAVRAAGYKGPLIGSPWVAPPMVPHYYNLRSDDLVGYIDRHDYFGGKIFDTMLTSPGGGYLSAGLQQVIDRPFGISEWCHVYPSLYAAEGPALMAAYGMGLQGWDASYEFQSSSDHLFNPLVGSLPNGVWQADLPTQIGQFPTLARMIARGDVKEAPVISVRHISQSDLETGKFSFDDKIVQNGDVKAFSGSVPLEALAVGRLAVQFDDSSTPDTFPRIEQQIRDGVLHSNTGQLAWHTGRQSYFTIDTPGTKGVVGFAGGSKQKLGDVEIDPQSPFASILLTAAGRNETLANCRTALISVVSRAVNSGFRYSKLDEQILDNGKSPILLEPVMATFAFNGRRIARVEVLDVSGIPTGRLVNVQNETFTLDGKRDKTLYYVVTFR